MFNHKNEAVNRDTMEMVRAFLEANFQHRKDAKWEIKEGDSLGLGLYLYVPEWTSTRVNRVAYSSLKEGDELKNLIDELPVSSSDVKEKVNNIFLFTTDGRNIVASFHPSETSSEKTKTNFKELCALASTFQEQKKEYSGPGFP